MTINNRFNVDALRNEVSDIMKGNVISLEPRLMKVLCLLIENRGQIITRDLIIHTVWGDYPGAGESLNQAISGLRKLLEDDHKKIIETIPKRGYCFNGSIEEASIKKQAKTYKAAYILSGVLMVIAFLFLVRYYQATKASVSEQPLRKEARNIFKIDSARQARRIIEGESK